MSSHRERHLMHLYLVRHGETEANAANIIQGQTDSPLTMLGVQQAWALAHRLSTVSWDACYTSDLGRARSTANIILMRPKHGHPHPTTTGSYHLSAAVPEQEHLISTALLRERSAGAYEGLKRGSQMRTPMKERGFCEDDEAVTIRVRAFLDLVAAGRGTTILAVSHGGWIGCLLRRVARHATVRTVPNASVSLFQLCVEDHRVVALRVCFVGDVNHLVTTAVTRAEWTDAALAGTAARAAENAAAVTLSPSAPSVPAHPTHPRGVPATTASSSSSSPPSSASHRRLPATPLSATAVRAAGSHPHSSTVAAPAVAPGPAAPSQPPRVLDAVCAMDRQHVARGAAPPAMLSIGAELGLGLDDSGACSPRDRDAHHAAIPPMPQLPVSPLGPQPPAPAQPQPQPQQPHLQGQPAPSPALPPPAYHLYLPGGGHVLRDALTRLGILDPKVGCAKNTAPVGQGRPPPPVV